MSSSQPYTQCSPVPEQRSWIFEPFTLLQCYQTLTFFLCLWQTTRMLKTHFQQSGEAAWGGIGGATMGNPLFPRTKDLLEESKSWDDQPLVMKKDGGARVLSVFAGIANTSITINIFISNDINLKLSSASVWKLILAIIRHHCWVSNADVVTSASAKSKKMLIASLPESGSSKSVKPSNLLTWIIRMSRGSF